MHQIFVYTMGVLFVVAMAADWWSTYGGDNRGSSEYTPG